MSEFEQPPYGELPELSGNAEHLDSHEPRPAFAGDGLDDLLPEPPVARRRGKVLVGATLGVLLLLGVAGAATAAVVLHRPDVQLARALSATQSAPQGNLTLSVKVDAAALSTAPAGMAETLDGSSLHFAWSPGTQQMSVTYGGKQVATVTTTDTHLTVQIDLANVPSGSVAADQLKAMADSLGADGAALTALAEGKPVGISTGPGSALRTQIDKAAKESGQAPGSDATANLSSQKAAEVLDAITQSVRSNTAVTSAGSDADGDRYLAKVSLKAVADTAWPKLVAMSPALTAGATKPDLSKLAGVTLDVDVWVKDGRISRIEIPLGALVRKLDPTSTDLGNVTIVAVLGTDGIVPPAGPVTEVPDSLITSLADGSAFSSTEAGSDSGAGVGIGSDGSSSGHLTIDGNGAISVDGGGTMGTASATASPITIAP